MNARHGTVRIDTHRRLTDGALERVPGTLRGLADELGVARSVDGEALTPPSDVPFEGGQTDRGTPFGDSDPPVQAADLICAVDGSTGRTWRVSNRLAAAGVDGPTVDSRSLLSSGGDP